MKKLLTMLLAGSICLSMTACTDKKDKEDEDEDERVEEREEEKKEKKEKKKDVEEEPKEMETALYTEPLRWVCIGDKPEDYDVVMKEVNKIVEPELGVELEIEFIDPAQFTDKTKTQMAAHDPVDLYFTGYVNNYQTAVEMKGLYDITNMIDNIKMKNGKTVSMSDVIPQYYLDAATVDGKIYGIPNQQVISNPNCLQLSKADADYFGVDLEGLEELAVNNTNTETSKAYMDKLTAELAKIKSQLPAGRYVINPSNPALNNIYEEIAGGVYVRKDGSSDELVITAFTPEWKYGVETIRKWYEAGYIRSDMSAIANQSLSQEEQDKFVVSFTTWKPGQEAYYKNSHNGEEPAYAFNAEPYIGRTSPLLTMISVGAFSKNPEAAVKLIYMVNSNKELYNLICWGIEGKHYEMNADGTATPIADGGYNIAASAWRYGNQFNGFVMEGMPADVWKQTEKMNDDARKSPAIGFVPDLTGLQSEIANIMNVNYEYKAKTGYGTDPVDSWYDDYIAALKTAGIEKVRDELQKQVDAWLASK